MLKLLLKKDKDHVADDQGSHSWISNHMPSNVCDKITYPFPHFNDATAEVSEWVIHFIHTLEWMWLPIYPGIKVIPR